MYNTILAVQYISIIGLFIEGWIVFSRWSGRLHLYLFFSIAATLVNNLGYLFELKASNMEEYITALQLSYFGRVWITFGLVMFISELCGISLPRLMRVILAILNAATYVVILTIPNNDLYYKNIEFVSDGLLPQIKCDHGIWHDAYMALLVFYIVWGMTMLFATYHNERGRSARKRLLIVIFAMVTEFLFFIMQMLAPRDITSGYDLTMLGYASSTFFMLVAIFRYDLLGTEQLAKEYIVDKLSEGIVAADAGGNVAYFNKPAEQLFPELEKRSPEVMSKLQQAITDEEPIQVNDRIYTPREDTLYRGEEVSGTIYVLHDNTDLYMYQSGLKQEVGRQTERADRLSLEMMIALSKTVDAKDHYTNGHSGRVAEYSAELARRMGKSEEEQEKIYEMGLMHDIGKIGISEEIINKTSRLTDEEFDEIKKHTVVGYDILSAITEMPELAIGARYHHERYDGKGYPDGLSGKDIPEAARIICLADCYDAMTSTRTYSEPKTQQEVRAEIVRCSGTQFDPDIAQVMIQMIDDDIEYKMNEQGGARVWKNRDKLRLTGGHS